MTYEELLSICDNYSFKDSAEPVKALRAVVELHKPIIHKGYENQGLFCANCEFDYPCLTIQAIEKELG